MDDLKQPLVLVADDDIQIVNMMQRQLQMWGYRTAGVTDSSQLRAQLCREQPFLIVLDLQFGDENGIEVMRELLQCAPGLTVLLLTGHGSIDSAIAAIKQGAYDFLTKPPDWPRLRVTIEHALEKYHLTQRIKRLEQMVEPQGLAQRIWGSSPAVNRLRTLTANVAATDATVLIRGESGTGKELVAWALHELSSRREGPFVPVNMAALPRELIESTLFGHEKGAFTGADRARTGCCEAAEGGTLFLDEIGEMDLDLQAKLLRFVQDHTLQRVGSNRTQVVNVRIVTATNQDLRQRVARGLFREDLYYRLNVVPIEVPALRERREDVLLLATRFLTRATERYAKTPMRFSSEAIALLTRYDWPGNVRQLENLVERLVILSCGGDITPDDLPAELRESLEQHESLPVSATSAIAFGQDVLPIAKIEKLAIIDALRKSGGNVRDAARLLGLGQATVYRKIKRLALQPQEYGCAPTA